MLNDRQLKLRELFNIANISKERVYNILQEHLYIKKLSARLLPLLLTDHDNALADTPSIVVEKLHELHFEHATRTILTH